MRIGSCFVKSGDRPITYPARQRCSLPNGGRSLTAVNKLTSWSVRCLSQVISVRVRLLLVIQ